MSFDSMIVALLHIICKKNVKNSIIVLGSPTPIYILSIIFTMQKQRYNAI